MKQNSHKKKHTKALIWLIVFTIITIGIIVKINSHYATEKSLIRANEGILDLSSFNFEKEKTIRLQGDAEFYWKQFLSPNDFKNTTPQSADYLFIPGKWNNLVKDGKKVGTEGFGTYRFTILTPDSNYYGLKIKEFESAFKIWINGKLMGGAGKVGKSKADMQPNRKRQEYYFEAENNKVEIIIQISNFHHRRGGASKPMIFGYGKEILDYKSSHANADYLLFGILLILSIYHLVLFSNRQSDKSVLYFSMLCFVMLLRMSTTGEKILLEIFPWLNYHFAMQIEYGSFFGIAIFICSYLHSLFPKDINATITKSIVWVSVAFILFICVTPIMWVTHTPYIFQILSFVPLIYMPIAVFKGILKHRQFALLTFGSILLFYVFVLNDYLYYNKLTNAAFLMPFGTSAFAILQAIVVSKKRSSDFRRIEMLSEELRSNNIMLEERVETRTQEISRQKTKIEKQNKKLKKLANFKNSMTQMMVHDLKSPLTNIIGFSEHEELYANSREFIQASGWQLQNLINNILNVDKYDLVKMKLSLKSINISDIINQAYNNTRFLIELKEIKFENKIPPETLIEVDSEIIERVFANIFSNAAKYGKPNGVIKVSYNFLIENNLHEICIYNSGEPIASDKIEEIFVQYKQLHKLKNEIQYSTGIGLAYCKMAIQEHGGTISVDPKITDGVAICIKLPCI